MGIQFRRISTTIRIMGKCIKIATYISGVIGIIWSAFIAAICVTGVIHHSEIQDYFARVKQACIALHSSTNSSDDFGCSLWDIQYIWCLWLIFSTCLISMCKFIANFGLLYGVKERKPNFVKYWLIVKFVDIFLAILSFVFVLIFIIHELIHGSNITKRQDNYALKEFFDTVNLIIICLYLLYILMKIGVCFMVSKVHKDLKNEDNEEKRQLGNSLHHDNVEIEKANGKYVRF